MQSHIHFHNLSWTCDSSWFFSMFQRDIVTRAYVWRMG
jgi:hypothetical protein